MRRLIILSIALFLFASIACGQNVYAREKMSIEIIPLGKIDDFVQDYLKGNLSIIFNAEVYLGEVQNVSESAFNKHRGQYHSTAILQELSKFKKGTEAKTLAVIDEDLYVPELNFVFGEADILNGVCIISLKRLHQSYYGVLENKDLFLKRSLKEAVHEIGHLLNLMHCPNPKCVMHFSNSLLDTDRKDFHFCDRCWKLLPLSSK